MPATLGHIGAQYLMTKLCLPRADVKWILTGCILPDIPWIIQRALPHWIGVQPIELRLYAIAQSSLLLSVILCACLALFSRNTWAVLATLVLGTGLHLGLDALQTKWANGVVLLAPLRWEMLNFGLFWPEDWPTHALYGLSVITCIWIWKTEPRYGEDLLLPRGARAVMVVMFLMAYLLLPIPMKDGARTADLHYTATLADTENRAGKPIEFDRTRLSVHPDAAYLRVWTEDTFAWIAPPPIRGDIASVRGQFETPTTIRVAEFHIHPSGVRSFASYVGLLLVVLWWGLCLRDRFRV